MNEVTSPNNNSTPRCPSQTPKSSESYGGVPARENQIILSCLREFSSDALREARNSCKTKQERAALQTNLGQTAIKMMDAFNGISGPNLCSVQHKCLLLAYRGLSPRNPVRNLIAIRALQTLQEFLKSSDCPENIWEYRLAQSILTRTTLNDQSIQKLWKNIGQQLHQLGQKTEPESIVK